MQKTDILLKNTILYAIANFGSKILSFLIVPLYTHYLQPSDLGAYDLIITTITLLIPIITFQMSDSIFRWLLEPEQSKENVINVGLKMIARNSIVATVLFFVFYLFWHFPQPAYVYILLILYTIVPVVQQIARGMGNNRLYAVSGVILTALFLLGNVLFVILLRWGVSGMLLSQVIAYSSVAVILLIWQPYIFKSLCLCADHETKRQMIRYSFPLIPNAISWWAINTANRYIILAFLGATANGIYAITTKFPSILQICTSIFYLAWQESAIREATGENSAKFYENVFSGYCRLLFVLTGLLIPLTRFVVIRFMDAAYVDAWKYSGFLYLGMVFSAFSSFLGTSYQVSKQTKGALYTTLLAAVVSILFCFVFVNFLGLQAVSLAIFISYLLLFFIRVKDCRKYVNFRISWLEFFIFFAYTIIITILTYFIPDMHNNWLMVITLLMAMVLLKNEWMRFLHMVKIRRVKT